MRTHRLSSSYIGLFVRSQPSAGERYPKTCMCGPYYERSSKVTSDVSSLLLVFSDLRIVTILGAEPVCPLNAIQRVEEY